MRGKTKSPAKRFSGARIGAPGAVFIALAAAAGGWVSFVNLFDPINIYSYSRDVWHHMATLGALMDSPLDPANPHVVSDAPSRTFTPWFWLIAVLGKTLGLAPLKALGMSALLNMGLLAAGVWLFARAYFPHRWAPPLLLAVMLGAWTLNFGWAGFYNFTTLVYSAGYPFATVLALGFFAWWAALKALAAARPGKWLAVIGLAAAVSFATHQLQAGLTLGGIGVFALFRGEAAFRRRIEILAAAGLGLAASMLWPFYNPLALVRYAALPGWNTAEVWDNPSFYLAMTGISALGVLGFYDWERRRPRFELVVGGLGLAFAFGGGQLLGVALSHRFFPFLMLFLHLGLTWLLLSRGAFRGAGLGRYLARVGHGVLAVAVGLLFAYNMALGVTNHRVYKQFSRGEITVEGKHREPGILEAAREVVAITGKDAVILGYQEAAYPPQALGVRVVSIPRPFPLTPDMAERQAAAFGFFQPQTTRREREAIIARYNATHILYRNWEVDPRAAGALAAFGEATAVGGLTLITLAPEREDQSP